MKADGRLGPRLRVAILVALGIWVALLAIALVGQSIGLPAPIVTGAVLIWAGAALFLTPSSWLLSLNVETGIGPGSMRAVRMAPYSLLVGSLAVFVGALLLVPLSSTTISLRVAGAYAVAWGAFVVSVGLMALRKKRRHRSDARP